jgi:hypothetical protein
MAKTKFTAVSGANPYEAPAVYIDSPQGKKLVETNETIRDRYMFFEVMMYVFGYMIMITAGVAVLQTIALAIAVISKTGMNLIFLSLMAGVVLIYGSMFYTGRKLLELNKIGRNGATIVASFLVWIIVFGTFPGVLLQWLMWSAKGETVFSKKYATVIAETREMPIKIPLIAYPVILCFICIISSQLYFSFVEILAILRAEQP